LIVDELELIPLLVGVGVSWVRPQPARAAITATVIRVGVFANLFMVNSFSGRF
jgi:hypothetical protein